MRPQQVWSRVSAWHVALGSLLVLSSLLAMYGWPIATTLVVAYISASIIAAIAIYTLMPRRERNRGRRLAMLLVGIALFGTAALRDPIARLFQIEGLFFDLLGGIWYAAVIHYLIAKVFGPLFFGRMWCGWACWTAMVLDQLPFKHSPGRVPGRWGLLRYAHFFLSLAVVVVLWSAYGYRIGPDGTPAIVWFIGGNLLYYAAGVGLAFVLHDNRAFCKYVCPIAVPLKLGAPFALLKIKTDPARCNRHEECEAVCPMDIDITSYIARGERVSSSECLLCQACVAVCPEAALSLSLGFERHPQERFRIKGPKGKIMQHNDAAVDPYTIDVR